MPSVGCMATQRTRFSPEVLLHLQGHLVVGAGGVGDVGEERVEDLGKVVLLELHVHGGADDGDDAALFDLTHVEPRG